MFRPLSLSLLVLVACTPEPEGSDPDPTGSTPTPTPTLPTGTDTDGTDLGDAAFEALAFFQAVAVPALVAGAPVDPDDRTAPLIAGRDAVLRAILDPAVAGDTLVVSVDLWVDGTPETFTAPAQAGVALVELPATAMRPDASYVVRLDVDGAPAGRFPADGEAALDAMETGPLAVMLVPFEVDGFVPDTSAAVVEGYRQALLATYPVTDVTLTVAPVEVWTQPFDLGDINVRVGVLQEEAMFAGEVGWDVYYYGMVTGVASRDQYVGITGTSEDGGSETLRRAYFAAGAAFGDQKSEDTLIHEIGHTHRLEHTACDGEDDVDPDYPHAGGSIGVEGYDRRTGTFLSPDDQYDLMSYCFPRWVSDYSWSKLADHVANAQDYAGFE